MVNIDHKCAIENFLDGVIKSGICWEIIEHCKVKKYLVGLRIATCSEEPMYCSVESSYVGCVILPIPSLYRNELGIKLLQWIKAHTCT